MTTVVMTPFRLMLMILIGAMLALMTGCQAKPAAQQPALMSHASVESGPDSIAATWISPSVAASPARPILIADAHAPAPRKPVAKPAHEEHAPATADAQHHDRAVAERSAAPAPKPPQEPKVQDPLPATAAGTVACPHCKHTLTATDIAAIDSEADAKMHPADRSLAKLLAGNKRFVDGKPAHPNQSVERRGELAKGQAPFAIILGCSDSRTAPEVVFDAGLGDVFPIRVAGNIADASGIASIEYAAEHLGTPLIVVLGHERCGAVKATCDVVATKTKLPGHLPTLTDAIKPAATSTQAGSQAEWCDRAVAANAKMVAAQLRSSGPVLSHLLAEGKIKIVAARYDLDSGAVTVLDDTPPTIATTDH